MPTLPVATAAAVGGVGGQAQKPQTTDAVVISASGRAVPASSRGEVVAL